MIQSGSSRRSSDAVEAVWTSLMPKGSCIVSGNEDEDVMKLSLLLQSTQLLLIGLRQKQSGAVLKVKSLTDELQAVTLKKNQYENDAKSLQKELSAMKFELESSELKRKRLQKEAESATRKWQQLQSKISSEVENRLNTMFKTCLQQNKAVTVQDMMTQMHQETPSQVTDCLDDGQPAAEVQQLVQLKAQETLQSKTPLRPKSVEESAHEKSLILATPDATERPAFGRNKGGKDHFLKPRKHLAAVMNSASSSPDEIAPTPPSADEGKKQESKKRGKKINFSNSNLKESGLDGEKAAIVYAKDTQDVTNLCSTDQRPPLVENIVIPETLNPEMGDDEISHRPPSRRDKENGNSLSATSHQKRKSPPSISTNLESLSNTPLKVYNNTRERSPVLGSGGKKHGARPLNTSLQSSSKKPRMKRESFLDGEVSYRRQENGKLKKSIQPTITGALSKHNKSKLSLKTSQRVLDFKEKPPTGSDLPNDITKLSEDEAFELAVANSKIENYSCRSDDTDVTMFLPISPPPKAVKSFPEERNTAVTSNISSKGRPDVKDEDKKYFEPMAASTEKDEFFSTQWKRAPPSHEELQSPFKPPFASTEKQPEFKFPLSSTEKQSGFKPRSSSTQKEPVENSALHDLVELLDEDDMDNPAPLPAENSYDRVPSEYYVNRGRTKNERKNLPALECTQCGRYFAAAFGDDEEARRVVVKSCSRHRDKNGEGPRPLTPPEYWNPGWHSPKEAQEV